MSLWLSFKSTLHILDNSPLSDMSLASTFSHAGLTSQEKCLLFFNENKDITGQFMCYLCMNVVLKCHSWAIIYQLFNVFLQFGAH